MQRPVERAQPWPRMAAAVVGQVSADTHDHDRAALDALLLEAASGDHDAFARLYDATAALVYGICKRVLRDAAQSEEVTQDVLLEIWRTAGRFDPAVGSARAWIATTAHRRAVDRVRSSQSSRDREERTPPATRAHDTVAEAVETAEERRLVSRALRGLTALQREAIELAYYGGRTYREVAAELDVPLPTVKTRMRDGLKRLGRELRAPEDGSPSTGGPS